VLTLAFVAQFAAHSLSLPALTSIRAGLLADDVPIVETGTVVQMPANPNGGRAQRAAAGREAKMGARRAPAGAKTPRQPPSLSTRVARPDPADEEPGAESLDQLRPAEGLVRITIIGPDGEPRTKVVRLSGAREGLAAPARRPHD
jgi:hypothetical protein